MATKIRGITIEIGGDTTGLEKSLNDVNKEIRSTQSQLKDVERLLKLDPKNTELLSQKQKLLAQEVAETKRKLDALKEANTQVAESAKNYGAWKAKYDPIKQEIDETKKKLAELKTKSEEAERQLEAGEISKEKYDSIQSEIKQTEDNLKDLKKQAKAVSDEFGNPISPEQYDAMQREIQDTERRLKDIEKQAIQSNNALATMKNAGESLKDFGGKATAVGKALTPVTAAVTAIGTAAVKTTADFDAAMSQVAAVSGAVGEEFDDLRDKAREMGAKTKFSASEAAEAMNYMAMAGWKTGDMLDGIEGIMNLAAASGENLATTSDIVTDALTAFGMSASDSGHFADILAAASSNANTNVSMLGESFKYVAPLAGSLGYSAEDVSIALGMMANSGIKASQGGTALRSIITRLVKPTKDSAKAMAKLNLSITETDGTMKPFMDVMEELRAGFSALTEDEKAYYAALLGGQEAMSGLLSIVNASEADFAKLSGAVSNCSGVTEEMADKMQDNLSGQLTILKSQLQEAAISIGDTLVPKIRELVGKIQEWTDRFNALSQNQKEMVVTIGLVVAATGPLLIAIGQMSTGLGAILTLTATLGASGGPLFLTAAAVTAIGAAFILAADNTVNYYDEAAKLTEAEEKNREKIDELRVSYERLAEARNGTLSSIEAQSQYESELWEELQKITDENGNVMSGYEDRAAFITSTLSEALGTEISYSDGIIQNYKDIQSEIDGLIRKKEQEATLTAYYAEYEEALRNQNQAQSELTEATANSKRATDEYNEAVRKQSELQSEYNRMQEEYLKDGTNDKLRQQLYDLDDQMVIVGETVEGLKTHMEKNNSTLDEARNRYEAYEATIANYRGASAAIMTENQEEISRALLFLAEDFKTAEVATKESLQEQYRTIVDELCKARTAIADGSSGFSREYVKNLETMEKEAAAQLKLISNDAGKAASDAAKSVKSEIPQMEEAWGDVAKGASKGLEAGTKDVNKSVDKLVKDSVEEFKRGYDINSPSKVTMEIGQYVAEGLQTGIEEGTNGILDAITKTAEQTAEKASLELAKDNFVIMGRQITSGLTEGIVSGKSSVLASVQQMCDETILSAKTKLGIHSPSTEFSYIGQMSGEGFASGWNSIVPEILDSITNSLGQATTQAAETFKGVDNALLSLRDSSGNTVVSIVKNAQEAQDALKEIQSGLAETISGQVSLFEEFDGKTELSTKDLLHNMQSQVDGTEKWAENLRMLAERGVDQGLLQKMAEMGPKGAGYVTVFTKMTDEELQRANALFAQSMMLPASATESIMQSYKIAGQMTAQGFGDGIAENKETAVEAASQIAANAVERLQEVLEIHSPSRVTAEAGAYFSAGFAEGIEDGVQMVESAVKNVTEAATATLRNNLNMSQKDISSFQGTTQGSWSTWASGLIATMKASLSQIHSETSLSLAQSQTVINTFLSNIDKEWEKQLLEIRRNHRTSMDEINRKTEDSMKEMSETVRIQTEQMKTDALTAMEELLAGTRDTISQLEPTVRDGYEPAVGYITGLIPNARIWANDMMDGYIQGIREKIRELESVCEDVADTVSDYLHFTRPEKGPLRYYEEWMPHMMQGFAKGIRDNRGLIEDQMKELAGSMAMVAQGGQGIKQPVVIRNFNQTILDGRVIAESVNERLGAEL